MWIYHAHTHAALLGWITCSFIGMIYIVIPSIVRANSLDPLRGDSVLSAMLGEKTRKKAFRQLTVLLLAATAIMVAFFLQNGILLSLSGFVFGASVFFLNFNLLPELFRKE
jgi:hypothetical protein